MHMFDELVQFDGKSCTTTRNGVLIFSGKCILHDSTKFDLPHDCDVQPGDIITLKASGKCAVVSSVEPIYCLEEDAIDFLEVHCGSATKTATPPHNVTYNIGNVYNSNIGENGTVNTNVSIRILENAIIQNGHSVDEFHELLETLQHSMEQNKCTNGFLSGFAGVLRDNSWLTQPLAQSLIAYFTGGAI